MYLHFGMNSKIYETLNKIILISTYSSISNFFFWSNDSGLANSSNSVIFYYSIFEFIFVEHEVVFIDWLIEKGFEEVFIITLNEFSDYDSE